MVSSDEFPERLFVEAGLEEIHRVHRIVIEYELALTDLLR
jgi:hypothetical protein